MFDVDALYLSEIARLIGKIGLGLSYEIDSKGIPQLVSDGSHCRFDCFRKPKHPWEGMGFGSTREFVFYLRGIDAGMVIGRFSGLNNLSDFVCVPSVADDDYEYELEKLNKSNDLGEV